MRGWTFLLGGLIVWAAHFFALYGIASIFLTTTLARLLTLGMTLLCLAVDAIWFRDALRCVPADRAEGWMRSVALCGLGLSAIAILWQALPALLV